MPEPEVRDANLQSLSERCKRGPNSLHEARELWKDANIALAAHFDAVSAVDAPTGEFSELGAMAFREVSVIGLREAWPIWASALGWLGHWSMNDLYAAAKENNEATRRMNWRLFWVAVFAAGFTGIQAYIAWLDHERPTGPAVVQNYYPQQVGGKKP